MVSHKTFLIIGSEGQLAEEFKRVLSARQMKFFAPSEKELNICDTAEVKHIVRQTKPDVILNCAAYNLVDEAEQNPAVAFAVNSEAVANLALLCRENHIFLVHFGTDYVFDGKKKAPYIEQDTSCPLNVYGQSKLKGEEAVKRHLEDFLIFRLSWVFGEGRGNFLYKLLQWAQNADTLKVTCDEVSVPTYTQDVVPMTLLSLERNLKGLYHLTNSGYCSRFELAKYFVEKMGLDNTVTPVSLNDFRLPAKRPFFSCLSNEKICHEVDMAIPTWQNAVDRFVVVLKKKISNGNLA